MEIKRPVFNFDNNKPSMPPKADAPKPQNKKDNIAQAQTKFESTNNVTFGSEEKFSAPKTYSGLGKKFWIIMVSFILAGVLAIGSVLIFGNKQPIIPADIIINIQAKPAVYDFSNLEENNFATNDNGLKKITVLPGHSFTGKFGLQSIANEDPTKNGAVFVRFRMYGIVEENYYGNMFDITQILEAGEDSEWFTSIDGYMYYRNLLNTNQEVDVESAITINGDSTTDFFQGKTVYLNCVFEVLQISAYQSITEVWTGAPYLWRTEIVEKVLQSQS